MLVRHEFRWTWWRRKEIWEKRNCKSNKNDGHLHLSPSCKMMGHESWWNICWGSFYLPADNWNFCLFIVWRHSFCLRSVLWSNASKWKWRFISSCTLLRTYSFWKRGRAKYISLIHPQKFTILSNKRCQVLHSRDELQRNQTRDEKYLLRLASWTC